MAIDSKGAVIVSKVTANNNSLHGIYIDNYQSGDGKGTVTLSYLTANNNFDTGIHVISNNTVTLSSATVMFTNSLAVSGAYFSTNNHNLTISNSLITANGNTGIRAVMGGTTGIFKLINTYYFGNCTVAGPIMFGSHISFAFSWLTRKEYTDRQSHWIAGFLFTHLYFQNPDL